MNRPPEPPETEPDAHQAAPERPCPGAGGPDAPPPCPHLRAMVAGDCARLKHRRQKRWLVFAGIAFGTTLALWAARQWVRPPSCHGVDAHGNPLVHVADSHCGTMGWTGMAVMGLLLVGIGFGVRLVPRRWMVAGSTLAAVGAWLLVGVASWGVSEGAAELGGPGIGCLALGLAWGLALSGLAWRLGRGLVRRAGPAGMVLGVGSGLVALALLQTVCPRAGALHALVGHGTVPALLGLLGAWMWTRTETTC